ncbi:uncharacterized protein K452DRAFT_53018 [Aplosporella prunicola CBS 121167]|uniref:CorA-like transporter domain-containing protein n=1 Tax=Aplosporella prunicola CBS 121167 TaxID=1176127 RepID=A0A6A6B806_9PEZI|nr:uncharacterized protein K452DRAFT_53018 [Aplosporella prunicola CBS 121167]KAF2140220.1 hypothetical protein K452DRAFT_53018 [Aplosporella prunicola CBS 121167]
MVHHRNQSSLTKSPCTPISKPKLPNHTVVSSKSCQKMLSFMKVPKLTPRGRSICQENSLAPFSITAACLQKLWSTFDISSIFLDVLLGIHSEGRVSEEAYGNTFYNKSVPSEGKRSFDIAYQLKYAEANTHHQGFPWSFRNTEVYHRFSSTQDEIQSSCLVFHPMECSKGEQRLYAETVDATRWSRMQRNPLRLHIVLVCTYVDNWRAVLAHLGKRYQDQRKAISTVDFEDDEDFNQTLNFATMLKLRALEERVQQVLVMLKTTQTLVEKLIRANNDLLAEGLYDGSEHASTASSLESILIRLNGYQDSVSALARRITSLMKLVTDALNLRNQAAAAVSQKIAANNQRIATGISQSVYKLTLDSVDDSAVVRVVTLATLLYLPGSFVASLLGMNVFDFDGPRKRLNVTKDFWVYIIVTIPLTMVTVLLWWVATRREKRKRMKKASSSGV